MWIITFWVPYRVPYFGNCHIHRFEQESQARTAAGSTDSSLREVVLPHAGPAQRVPICSAFRRHMSPGYV